MNVEIISYQPYLKALARQKRLNSTFPEVLLWNALKQKKMRGYDFDRQRPIDHFIVDFYCKKLKLALEVDGNSHNGRLEEDRIRQERLEALGVRFLRFTNDEVKHNIKSVLRTISSWILDWEEKNHAGPTPDPSLEGNYQISKISDKVDLTDY